MSETEHHPDAPAPRRSAIVRAFIAFARWFDTGLNNAVLASVATYYGCVPGFERVLRASDGDLPRFYAAVKGLAAGPAAERAALCAR